MSLVAVDATSSIAENKKMSNTFRKDFGNKIKELRNKQNITQEELSFRSGVSRSHIGMIEKGLRDISLSAIFKISRALQTPLNELFRFDSINKYPKENNNNIIS